jgi:MoaA/NifB/PqqE/SkfB family radical SAM enzyme
MMNTMALGIRMARAFTAYRAKSVRVHYPPIRVWIEPTNRCNLRCIMCPNSLDPAREVRRGLMSIDLFRAVISEVSQYAYDVVLHVGGESLLHPQISEMVAVATRAGLRTALSTNGTVLTESAGRKLIKAGLTRVTFSFDGYDKENYERIRVGASFETVKTNIKRFLALKRGLNSRIPHTTVQVIEFDGAAVEVDVKARFMEEFKDSPPDRIQIIPPHSFGGRFLQIDRARGSRYMPCTFPWYALTVLWDGRVVPCCVDVWGDMVLGSFGKDRLIDVWTGSGMADLRGRLARGDIEGARLCRTCDLLWKESGFRYAICGIF